SYTYDTGANPITAHALSSVTDPAGTHTFYSYDAQGRLADVQQDAGGQDTTFTYVGGRVSVSDALHNTTTYSFDHRGLVAQVENPLHNSLYFTYDKNLKLMQTADPLGQISTNTYDARGNLSSTTDPLGHTISYSWT